MNDKLRVLTDRIAERLVAVGLSEREASIQATGKPDAIRYIRTRGAMPSAARLLKLSNVLKASVAYLLGEQADVGWEQIETVSQIYGYATERAINEHLASGADAGNPYEMGILVFHAEPGEVKTVEDVHGEPLSIQPTVVNSTVIEFSDPPRSGWNYENSTLAYYTTEDAMSPAFEKGWKVFLQPDIIPSVGDYVVAKLKAEGEQQRYILRRVVGISKELITLRQYAPHSVFQLKLEDIDYLARVLSYADIT